MKFVLIFLGLVLTFYCCSSHAKGGQQMVKQNNRKGPPALHHSAGAGHHMNGNPQQTKSKKCKSSKFFRLSRAKAQNHTHRDPSSEDRSKGGGTKIPIPYVELAEFGAAFSSAAIELIKGNSEKALWIMLDQFGPFGTLITSIFGLSRPVSTDTQLVLNALGDLQLTADQILHKLNKIVTEIALVLAKHTIKENEHKVRTVVGAFHKYVNRTTNKRFKAKFIEQCKAQNLEHIFNTIHFELTSFDSGTMHSLLIARLNDANYLEVILSLLTFTTVTGSLYLTCLQTEFYDENGEIDQDDENYLQYVGEVSEKYFHEISDAVRRGERKVRELFSNALKIEVENTLNRFPGKGHLKFAVDLFNDLNQKFGFKRWMVNSHISNPEPKEQQYVAINGSYSLYYQRSGRSLIVSTPRLSPPATEGNSYQKCFTELQSIHYFFSNTKTMCKILVEYFKECVAEYSVLACVKFGSKIEMAADETLSEQDYMYHSVGDGNWFQTLTGPKPYAHRFKIRPGAGTHHSYDLIYVR